MFEELQGNGTSVGVMAHFCGLFFSITKNPKCQWECWQQAQETRRLLREISQIPGVATVQIMVENTGIDSAGGKGEQVEESLYAGKLEGEYDTQSSKEK